MSEIDWNTDIDWQDDANYVDAVEEKTATEKRAITIYNKNLRIHRKKAKSLEDIAPLPEVGEQHVIITEKQFNAFALILRILQDAIIEEMYLAIYRINKPTVDHVINMIDAGKIKKGRFVISNFFRNLKNPEKWALRLRKYCNKSNRFDHIYTHNHAKVLACRTSKNGYFVFEGSGNMSDNARIEQYRYEHCKETYEFHKSWMMELSDG